MKSKLRFVLRPASAAAVAGIAMAGFVSTAAAGTAYEAVHLVSNQAGVAAHQDPDLVNAWGISHGPNTPIWISDNATNRSTLYDRNNGTKVPLTVRITHGGAPTGTVFVPQDNDGDVDFAVREKGVAGPSIFLFVTEAGKIEGWNPNVDPNRAIVAVNRSSQGSVFKGMDIDPVHEKIYVADFTNDRVEVFDHKFRQVGAFTDPTLPRRFAPFNVALLNGRLYVSFAKREAGGIDDVHGPGLGYVDVFDGSGRLLQHLIANGPLNAPWGMTIAPQAFGRFAGALLVGNFGNGKIHAFDPNTGAFLGSLRRPDGRQLVIDGLWALDQGPLARVTFTAGPDDESNGLLGQIRVARP